MEKQEKKTSKLRAWWNRYKYHIQAFGICAALYGGGVCVGNYISNYQQSVGTLRLHDKGIVKYFDPDTGMEVNIEEACEVVKRVFKK